MSKFYHVTSESAAKQILKTGFTHAQPSYNRFDDIYEWFTYYHIFAAAISKEVWKEEFAPVMWDDSEPEDARSEWFKKEWEKRFGDNWSVMWVGKDKVFPHYGTQLWRKNREVGCVLEYIPDDKDFVVHDLRDYYAILRLEKTFPARNFKLVGYVKENDYETDDAIEFDKLVKEGVIVPTDSFKERVVAKYRLKE